LQRNKRRKKGGKEKERKKKKKKKNGVCIFIFIFCHFPKGKNMTKKQSGRRTKNPTEETWHFPTHQKKKPPTRVQSYEL
jgi:hypothetical protein